MSDAFRSQHLETVRVNVHTFLVSDISGDAQQPHTEKRDKLNNKISDIISDKQSSVCI